MSASRFLLSGSEDLTLKYWSLPSSIHIGPGCPVNLHATVTERAHEKDINFVAVAPNDHFVASASQDKTAKVITFSIHIMLQTHNYPPLKN